MEQHPVPQDIATYQFRLVGNMTLRQFLELAAGIVLAVLIYTTPLYAVFKWPIIFLLVFSGAAFAFLPIQERPMDVWIRNFLRSIYSPTQFLWKKEEALPGFLLYEPHRDKTIAQPKLTPQERERFAEYMRSLPLTPNLSAFDLAEKTNLDKINQFFQGTSQTAPISTPTINSAPQPTLQATPQPTLVNQPVVEIANPFTPPMEIGTPFRDIPEKKRIVKPKPKPRPYAPAYIPTAPVLPAKPKLKINPPPSVSTPTLPLPAMPEFPNVVVGMVLDNNAKILANAIIEIRDKNQMPVRASKTNKLGQFFIATPLPSGDYEMEVEAEPLSFAIIKFSARGKIIPPFKIQADSVMEKNVASNAQSP